MITVEEMVGMHERSSAERKALQRQRAEIDIAYQRGFDDGSGGVLPALVTGVLAGATGAGALCWVLLSI